MPLTTAPSLTPEELVLLLGALWGARLGRNRHLVGTGDTVRGKQPQKRPENQTELQSDLILCSKLF